MAEQKVAGTPARQEPLVCFSLLLLRLEKTRRQEDSLASLDSGFYSFNIARLSTQISRSPVVSTCSAQAPEPEPPPISNHVTPAPLRNPYLSDTNRKNREHSTVVDVELAVHLFLLSPSPLSLPFSTTFFLLFSCNGTRVFPGL